MDWTRRLRLQHLQLLVSLMETGNLSGTARAAHTTQPGLSKWLKELEEDVGAPLFERHARGLRPTPYGMTLFNHAQRVLTEMERARQNLEAMRSGSGSRYSSARRRPPRRAWCRAHCGRSSDATPGPRWNCSKAP